MNSMFEIDIGEIWLKGKIEKDRIIELHKIKNPTIEKFPNGFKKFYCPICNEEFHNKKNICFCGQHIKWDNEYPWY